MILKSENLQSCFLLTLTVKKNVSKWFKQSTAHRKNKKIKKKLKE